MQLITVAEILLRRWWLPALLAVIGVGAGYVWSATAPRRYESVVTLQLNPAGRSALLPYRSDASEEAPRITTLAASYAEVLRSRAFGELVVQRLKPAASPGSIAGAINTRLVPNTNILRLTVSW